MEETEQAPHPSVTTEEKQAKFRLIPYKIHTNKVWDMCRAASSQWLTPRNEIDITRQARMAVLHTLSSPFHPLMLRIESLACPMSD